MITVEKIKVGPDTLYQLKGDRSDFTVCLEDDRTLIQFYDSDRDIFPFLEDAPKPEERPATLEEIRDKIDLINNNFVKFLLTPRTPM